MPVARSLRLLSLFLFALAACDQRGILPSSALALDATTLAFTATVGSGNPERAP